MLLNVWRTQIQAGIGEVKRQEPRRLCVASGNTQALREVAQPQVAKAGTEAYMVDANPKIIQQARAEAVRPADRHVFARLLGEIRIGSRPQQKRLSEWVGHVKLGIAAGYVISSGRGCNRS